MRIAFLETIECFRLDGKTYRELDYTRLSAVLVEAIKELADRVDELAARIDEAGK